VFALGLVLVVLAGSELLTGNMALVPLAMMRGRVGFRTLRRTSRVVLIGNLLGSLFVAYFLAVKTGVIGTAGVEASSPAGMTFERLSQIAVLKGDTEGADQIFLRALGCNWLVCLAVWVAMSAKDTGGKILGIFFPIMAFVAIGFDHVVANMFFPPGRDLRRGAGHHLGRRALQLAVRVHRQPGRRGDLRLHRLLVPVPQGRAGRRRPERCGARAGDGGRRPRDGLARDAPCGRSRSGLDRSRQPPQVRAITGP
jgi:formate/nitrite transporter FocA (FNT family)